MLFIKLYPATLYKQDIKRKGGKSRIVLKGGNWLVTRAVK